MLKKLFCTVVCFVMTLSIAAGCADKNQKNSSNDKSSSVNSPSDISTEKSNEGKDNGEDKYPGMRDITTMELVDDMGIGINLGNTMESCGDWINGITAADYETAWGSPEITEDIIKGYADEGFGVLRIPVAWSNLMDVENNYTIDSSYMERVTQIVDWTIDNGMYAIVNIHWDGGWWTNFPTDKENCMKKYIRIWEQICENFKDYNDYLMFESLNEEGNWESLWNRYNPNAGDKQAAFGLLNEINQTFVDTVRNSGGNNAKRHLLIAGYGTDIELTCDDAFKMPNDSENRCAVSVHYYTPATFCILSEDAEWGKAKTEWGDEQDLAELDKNMDMMKEKFVDNGIPVIIGEYGVEQKNKTPEMVRLFISTVCREVYERDMCPVLWDVTGAFYDRTNCEFIDRELIDEMMSVLDE